MTWIRGRRAALAICLLLALVAGMGLLVIEQHHRLRREAAAEALADVVTASVQAVGQQLRQTLEAVGTLHILGSLLHAKLADGDIDTVVVIIRYLEQVVTTRKFAAMQLALIDAQGWVIWSTVPGWTPVNLSDREHFQVHRDGRREPFASHPVIGRVTQQRSVQLTRPLLDSDGGFQGVVVVSLDPASLSQDIGSLELASRGVVTVFRDDGTVLARSSGSDRFVGAMAPPELRDHIRRQTGPGVEKVRSVILPGLDRPRVLGAFQRMEEWPLVIGYAMDPTPADQEARALRDSQRIVLGGLIALLACLALIASTLRERIAATRAARISDAARRELQSLLEALPGATYRAFAACDGGLLSLHVWSGLSGAGSAADASAPDARFTEVELPEAHGERAAFLRRVAELGEATTEYQIATMAGGRRWVRDHAKVVGARRGEPVEIVGIMSDITEERSAKAKALAGAKLATLGEMATGLAHELSQPCAAIGLAADIATLELGGGNPGRIERVGVLLDDIVTQIMRMRQVIDHFQLFARGDARAEGSFELDAAVRGALAIMRGVLSQSGVRVTCALEPSLPAARGNQLPFEQALVNFLVNARDAMEDVDAARREIHLSAWRNAATGEIVLTVSDTGPGVPADILDRVFEPFFTTKPPDRGIGLGLSIAYGTVRSAGGRIEIANAPQGGAQVTVHLQPACEPKTA